MKKTITLLCALLCISICTCSKKQIKSSDDLDPVSRFFSTFENDMTNTTKVISNNELIKNLTHLQRMDYGGSRYYPLERDALTKMIQSLSSFSYADCFLINSSGTIIYTMFDDKTLSKRAESFPSSLSIIFRHCKDGEPYILDVAEFPELVGGKRLYFGMPVKRGQVVEGVLIAALNVADVKTIAEIKHEAVDENGIVRVSSQAADLLTEISAIKSAAQENRDKDIEVEIADRTYRYHAVSFRNIRWLIRDTK